MSRPAMPSPDMSQGQTLGHGRMGRGGCVECVPMFPHGGEAAVRRRTVWLMARILRRTLPDGFFHVTTHGVAGALIFLDDDDRLRFLALLAHVVERFAWRCHAFC